MTAKKKSAKKEVEVIEAEVVNEIASESITNINDYVVLKNNYDELSQTVNTIRGLLNDTINNYLKIGYLLSSISDEELKQLGCESIYEFSKQNFNLGVTSTKNFINVYQRFGENTCEYDIGIQYMPNYIRLKDEYKEFSMSQLVELLPVADEDFEKFNPEMTCKEIRALKKTNQLTDFENEFYEKVKKTFLEMWNNIFPKIEFDTKNKLENGIITFDGKGNYSFNLPCNGKKILITLNARIKENDFTVYLETPRIDYNSEYKTFYIKLIESDHSKVEKEIINFINNDCYKFLNVDEKKENNSYVVLNEFIDKISEKYVGTFIKLSDLIHGDFFDLLETAKKYKDYSARRLVESLEKIAKYTNIPNTIFQGDFKLTELGMYDIKLEKVIFENMPDETNNPDYELRLKITEISICFIWRYQKNKEIISNSFNIDDFFKKYRTINFLNKPYERSFNSIYSMYEYCAKLWALEEYEEAKNSNDNEDEYDEDESDGEDDEEE